MESKITGSKLAEVVSSCRAQEGTLVVEMYFSRKHPKYKKIERFRTRVQVQYDRKTPLECGSKVFVKQCKPVSKTKRWKVVGFYGI